MISLTLGYLLCTQTSASPKLSVSGQIVTLSRGSKVERFSLAQPTEKAVMRIQYRKDGAFVVWDARGLSIRHGTKIVTSLLPDISLTPKLFTKDEIIETRKQISAGNATREASALSGSLRVGNFVYLLVRWERSDRTPWLEALVRVDLATQGSKAELLGKFDGLSLARGPLDSKLFLTNGKLGAFTTNASGVWGLSTYDPRSSTFGFETLGTDLLELRVVSPSRILAIEGSTHGATLVSRVDVSSMGRRTLLDIKGKVSLVDSVEPPLAVISKGGQRSIQNLDTGAVRLIGPTEQAFRAFGGVLLVQSASKPTRVRYLELQRLDVEATWPQQN